MHPFFSQHNFTYMTSIFFSLWPALLNYKIATVKSIIYFCKKHKIKKLFWIFVKLVKVENTNILKRTTAPGCWAPLWIQHAPALMRPPRVSSRLDSQSNSTCTFVVGAKEVLASNRGIFRLQSHISSSCIQLCHQLPHWFYCYFLLNALKGAERKEIPPPDWLLWASSSSCESQQLSSPMLWLQGT